MLTTLFAQRLGAGGARNVQALLYLALWLALAWPPLASAETFYYPTPRRADFSLELPSGWRVAEQQSERFTLQSPSQLTTIKGVTVRGEEEEALNLLVAETEVSLRYDLTDHQTDEGFQPLALANLKGIQFKARGQGREGGEVVIDYVIINPKGNLWVLLQAISDTRSPPQEQAQLAELFDSLRAR